MHIVNRFEKVRLFNPKQCYMSPEFVFNTKTHLVAPYNIEDWKYFDYKYKKNIASFRGGNTAYPWQIFEPNMLMMGILDTESSFTNSTFDLSGNYVPNTSGPAHGIACWQNVNSPISDIYFYIASYGGTAALVDDIDVEVRNWSTVNNRPDGSSGGLIQKVTVNPASATGWIKVSGFSASPTYQGRYAVVIGDPDGGGNYARLTINCGQLRQHSNYLHALLMGQLTTSNGWSSGAGTTYGSSTESPPNIVIVHQNGYVEGNSLVTITAHTSNTVTRGLYMGDVPFGFRILMFCHINGSVNAQTGKVFDGTTAPTGTALYTTTDNLFRHNDNLSRGSMFRRPFPELVPGSAYRVVMTPTSGNSTVPAYINCGTGSDANVRKARFGYGQWYYTDSSGGSWVDTVDSVPDMSIVVSDVVSTNTPLFVPVNQRTFPRIPIGY